MTAPFLILAAITLAGAGAAMGLRSVMHCVLALTVGTLGLAMLYLGLGAQFVGFTQVLVYVGAVAVLAVFAMMLTRSTGPHAQEAFSSYAGAGLAVAGAVFAVLAWAILGTKSFAVGTAKAAPAIVNPTVPQIGDALMRRFVLPLEIVGALLTVALIGAVILAMPSQLTQSARRSQRQGRP